MGNSSADNNEQKSNPSNVMKSTCCYQCPHNTKALKNLKIFQYDKRTPLQSRDFKRCLSICRILSALSHYTSLNIQSNSDNLEDLTKFINEIYKEQMLNDYHHLMQCHQHQD